MKQLDRYLLREMVVPFLIGQGAVVLMLTGTVLYNNADVFLNFGVPASGIVKIALYFLPYLVNLTMPVAVALACSLTVSRLARDTEITVMRSAGISLKRIFLPIIVAGLLISVTDFYFGEWIVPWAIHHYELTMSSLSRNIRFLSPQEGKTIQSPDNKYSATIGEMTVLPGSHHAMLSNVCIIANGAGPQPVIMMAKTAEYSNGEWILYNAHIHIYSRDGMNEKYIFAKTETINFKLSENTFNFITLQLPLYSSSSGLSFHQLSQNIAQERSNGWVNPHDLLDWQFKLSVPFSCLVFAIICPPFALMFAKTGNFTGVLISIILVFIYWNFLLASKIIGTQFPQYLPPFASAWGQNILFVIVGLWLLRREE